MKNPDPTPCMRWWDYWDFHEMRYVTGLSPTERNTYTADHAEGEYDHFVNDTIFERERKWHEYLGDRRCPLWQGVGFPPVAAASTQHAAYVKARMFGLLEPDMYFHVREASDAEEREWRPHVVDL